MTRPTIIQRPRLSKALAARSTVWVWGAAGTGKTTLVHLYLGSAIIKAKTHRLDRADRDLTRVFERIASLFPELTRGMMAYPGAQFADPLVFARHFWSHFWAAIPASTVIVLEDHHELGNDPVLNSILREAIVALPAERAQRLIITSRDDVPEQLTEFVVLDVMAVIDDSELRFTREEAKALTLAALGSKGAAGAEAIYELSDGWAACHVRLIEHLKVGGELPKLPPGDGPHALYAYLAQEVVAALAPPERATLLAAALLGRANPQLVATLTEDAAASRALARLLTLGLVRRGDTDSVVAVHPLLAAACQQFALRELGAESWKELTLRAVERLAANGSYDEAIDLALRHGEHERASHWIGALAFRTLISGRVMTLVRWLTDLPAELVGQDTRLSFFLTQLTTFGTSRATAQRTAYLALVNQGDWLGAYVAWTLVADELANGLEAQRCAEWLNDLDSLAAVAARPADPDLDPQFPRALRLAQVCAGRERLTLEVARELVTALTEGTTNCLALTSIMWKLHFYEGPAAAAALLVDAERRLSVQHQDPLAAIALVLCRHLVLLSHGRHVEAVRGGFNAMEVAAELGLRMMDLPVWAGMATSAIVADDLDAIVKYQAHITAAASNGTNFEEAFRHFALGLCTLRRGDLSAAKHHVANCQARAHAMGLFETTCCAGAIEAQVLHACGEISAAEALLDELIAASRRRELKGFLPTLLLSSSALGLRAGHLERALCHAEQGLSAAQIAGGMIPGVPHAQLAEICALALGRGAATGPARWMITALELDPPPGQAGLNWHWPIVVRAFGCPSVVRDQNEIEAPTGKAGELFWLLIALGGRDVPVTSLCDRLWPDADGDAARRAFDTTLHRLRQAAPFQDLILLSNGRLGLSRKSVWIDVDVVRRLARAESREDPTAAAAELWHAYRGELCGDATSFPWAAALAEELRVKARRAVVTLADALREGGQRDEADRLNERARAFGLLVA